jgi:hypothetical protein
MTTAPTVLPPAPALDEPMLVKLARDVVMNIHDLHVVLSRYQLTQSQYDLYVAANPFFRKIADQFRIEWEGVASTSQRMKIKAQVALEENMSTLAARMGNKDEDLGKATETAKLFARIAGVEAGDKFAGTGEKIVIEINLGADEKIKFEKEGEATAPVIIDGTVTEETSTAARNVATIPSDA